MQNNLNIKRTLHHAKCTPNNLLDPTEVDGEVKRGRKGRYKPGGPVLNVVFSNGAREVDQGSNTAGETAGFLGSLKTDLYLQRLSRIQINNFVRPKVKTRSIGVEFECWL